MTVYVDDARIPARIGRHDTRWSHLFADTQTELHEFAARLGLHRRWFQDPTKVGKPRAKPGSRAAESTKRAVASSRYGATKAATTMVET